MDSSLMPTGVMTPPPLLRRSTTTDLQDVQPILPGEVPVEEPREPIVEEGPRDDVQGVSVSREVDGPIIRAEMPVLQPLDAEAGSEWLSRHGNDIPTSVSASRDNLVFKLTDGTTTTISARQVEALVNDDGAVQGSPLAHAALIFDAGTKAGLPASAINSILKAYAKEVPHPPAGASAAFQKAMTTLALAADVENYVRNPKGLARDMKHVGAFTDEAVNGLHLKGMKSKLRNAGMKMEVIRQHQYALDDGLNRFASAFSAARETGDYAGAFDALQRFYQRAGTMTSTSYWQARPQLVAKDLAPPDRPAQPSDLAIGSTRRASKISQQAQTDKAERLVALKPQQPSRAARFWSAVKSPFVAIGELRAEKRAAVRYDAWKLELEAAQGVVTKLNSDLTQATKGKEEALRGGRSTVSHETAIRRATQAIGPAKQKLELVQQKMPGLVGLGAAAGVITRLREEGSIPAKGSASGMVETRVIDLDEVIVGAAYTEDLNSYAGPGDAYTGIDGVQTKALKTWADLPDFLKALRQRQTDAPTVRGELRHVILNLTVHGNEWGFMSITGKGDSDKTLKSHASAAWVNEQIRAAGFSPLDITVVSDACNGGYVYERSRGGIDESLNATSVVAKANKTQTDSRITLHDVSGKVREAHQKRQGDRDFQWIGRDTHENLGPSVFHQYVSGLGLSQSVLDREESRRHTVQTRVYLSGEVLREHLPIVSLNETQHTFVSDGVAPALTKTDHVGLEMRLDMHSTQSILHQRDEVEPETRRQIQPSTLSGTSMPKSD